MIRNRSTRQVLNVIAEKLYTPLGLRSLSSEDSNYRPRYGGDPFARDSAYHQGTVWSWLLAPFVSALVRVKGEAGKNQAKKIFEAIKPHLCYGAIGTISEIFDGDPPHLPRGAVAQVWSVAELLRSYVEMKLRRRDEF